MTCRLRWFGLNRNQMLISNMAKVWANSMACLPEPRITLPGAGTWWIHCHDSRATCHIAGCSHLAKSMSWPCHIAGCKNSIRHIENLFRHIFVYFLFLMEFRLWRAAALLSSPIHLLLLSLWTVSATISINYSYQQNEISTRQLKTPCGHMMPPLL